MLLALEVGWRAYVSNFGTQRQKVLYLYTRAEVDALQSLFRGMPFLNYGLTPGREDVNSLGYRGEDIAQPKPPDAYRIVAMGGSTTYGGYLDSYKDGWPYKLQQRLRMDHGYEQVESDQRRRSGLFKL